MREMGIKCILLICIFLLVLSMPSLHEEKKTTKAKVEEKTKKKKEEKKEIMVSVTANQQEQHIPLEEYLLGVVASEMPYDFSLEALKAQAIAARTFVLQRNLKVDATTSSQVYKSQGELKEIFDAQYDTMLEKVSKAVEETKGKVMMYDGKYISAMFYSSNNGYSNDASWYYKNEVPYLKSVESKWDLQFEKTNQSIALPISQCKEALQVTSLNMGGIQHYPNGYVKSITIGGTTFSGREVREKLHLRSSCFTMQVQGDSVLINTVGFGHGVGMSQYGAQGMALEGYNCEQILTHYYTGITISSI